MRRAYNELSVLSYALYYNEWGLIMQLKPLITLRATHAEKAAWQQQADAAGMSLSAWIRSRLVSTPEVAAGDQPQPRPARIRCPHCTRMGYPACAECRKAAYQG